MPASIKFDGTELVGLTYMPRWLMHESSPARTIVTGERGDSDGSTFVSSRYGEKRINLRGTLTAASKAALDDAIDAFKELLGREQKTLLVDFGSATREYVATCVEHSFDRDHCDFEAVEWSAVFVVPSGEGKDTSATLALNEHVVLVTTPHADSFTIAGSKPPKPAITIKGANFHSYAKGIEYRDDDTGERIVFTKDATWGNESSVVIDCENRKVTSDIASPGVQVEGDFYGVFPEMRVGTNNVTITSGSIVNQKSADVAASDSGSAVNLNATTKYKAQSFRVPYRDETFQGLTIMVAKVGSPGAITLRVETDADGEPSGTYADIAHTSEATIAAAAVGAKAYVTGFAAAPFVLPANTDLWLVIRAAGVDASNYYEIHYLDANSVVPTYQKGRALESADSGSTWSAGSAVTWCFRVLFGGRGGEAASVKHTVSYKKTYL
jgi:uncharacterized protein YndB with AHSA1/START domain